MAAPLAIREDKKEIYVQGLSEYNVKSVVDTLQLLKVAEDNRYLLQTNVYTGIYLIPICMQTKSLSSSKIYCKYMYVCLSSSIF